MDPKNDQQPEKLPTELTEHQKAEIKYFQMITPYLELKAKYDDLQVRLQENQVKRLEIMQRFAQIKAPAPGKDKEEKK